MRTVTITFSLMLAVSIFSTLLDAQTPSQVLKTAIEDRFIVTPGSPPTLNPAGATTHAALRDVFSHMIGAGFGGLTVDTNVNGVSIRWADAPVSYNVNNSIVISTGTVRAGDSDATALGDNSAAFAAGQDGVSSVASSGQPAVARCTGGGSCMAFAQGGFMGGVGFAECANGDATAIGGDADAGNGGAGHGIASGFAQAQGGTTTDPSGSGGSAEATSHDRNAVAVGGRGKLGGNATAIAEINAQAAGGIGSSAGGFALADANTGSAQAAGGRGDAQGGNAEAIIHTAGAGQTATAKGGDALPGGTGGSAQAANAIATTGIVPPAANQGAFATI